MPKFCGKCGSPFDEITGKCPKCDSNTEQNVTDINSMSSDFGKNQKKSLSKNDKKDIDNKIKQRANTGGNPKKPKKKVKSFFIKLISLLLVLSVLAGSITCFLAYFDVIDVPVVDSFFSLIGVKKDDEESDQESYEAEYIDADEYFKNNSKVISEINAKDSKNVKTEKETVEELADRGFKEVSITTEYNMDGEYETAVEISDTSSDKHPMYQMVYFTDNGDLWNIMIINHCVLANPVSYNLQSTRGAQLIISETDTVISYDSVTNKFFETKPNESELIVKKINKINAETLSKLTMEEIDKL